jgi:hypothetical protein
VHKSLKTKIVAAISLTITFWGVSGFLARKHATSFFAEHENRIVEQGKQGKVLDELRQEKSSRFRELAGIRLLTAAAAISRTFAGAWDHVAAESFAPHGNDVAADSRDEVRVMA